MNRPTGDYLATILASADDYAEQADSRLARVRKVSDTHTGSVGTPVRWEVQHTGPAPVRGCAWCVPEERARELHTLLDAVRPLAEHDWESPPMRSARFVAAWLDLTTEEP